jgi:A/G-specific adenine glycosylase
LGAGQFGEAVAILDQNVIRILSRVFDIKSSKSRPHTDQELWIAAQYLLPDRQVREYNLALLDFSAKVCIPRYPKCEICPIKSHCNFYKVKKETGENT